MYLRNWNESPALSSGMKAALQDIVDQVPKAGGSRHLFEQVLTALARGPVRYVCFSEDGDVYFTDNDDLATAASENDWAVADLYFDELPQLTAELAGHEEEEEEEEEGDDE